MSLKNMLSLYSKLTSGRLEVRKNTEFPASSRLCNRLGVGLWVRVQNKHVNSAYWVDRRVNFLVNSPEAQASLRRGIIIAPTDTYQMRGTLGVYGSNLWSLFVSIAPWDPLSVNGGMLAHNKPYWTRSSPERKPGLADTIYGTSRVKYLNMADLLKLSYKKDLRFVLVVCLMIGLGVWWTITPEPILLKPMALASPDLKLIHTVIKDTYIHNVCSSHPTISSPCICGEPLNMAARDLFPEPKFDPLTLNQSQKVGVLAVLMASVVLAVALTESVSVHGVLHTF